VEYAPKGDNISLDSKRDVPLLQTIYQLGGIIHKRHLKVLFWPNAVTDRALEKRVNEKLSHNGYILRTSEADHEEHPMSEGVYCLGIRGAVLVAKAQGLSVAEPETLGTPDDKPHRNVLNQLKKQDFYWRRVPNWEGLPHDLKVIDVYVALRRAIEAQPGRFHLLQWVHEGAFRHKSSELQTLPDAYLKISDTSRPGLAARFLIEMDRGNYTHDTFIAKIKGELEYFYSPAYLDLAKHVAGRWLIVFEKEGGMENLLPKIATAVGDASYLFLTSSLDQVMKSNPITDAIWHQPGEEKPRTLLLD